MTELAKSLDKCVVKGNTVFLPPISEGPLHNYQEVRTALLKAGAKYKRNTFIFNSDAKTFVDRLTAGESVNIKKEFQFFETPDDIADWLVELAEINMYDEILEPSAGQGALVKAIHRNSHPGRTVWGFELMPENAEIVKKISGFRLLGEDFLAECDSQFSLIIANPPFSKNQDIDHINKMYECLEEGGRLVTIASKHWQLSTNKKETQFRKWLEDVKAKIIQIGRGGFKVSGTMVDTCIIVINK